MRKETPDEWLAKGNRITWCIPSRFYPAPEEWMPSDTWFTIASNKTRKAGRPVGLEHTEESKRKMSEAMKKAHQRRKRVHSEETKKRISEGVRVAAERRRVTPAFDTT